MGPRCPGDRGCDRGGQLRVAVRLADHYPTLYVGDHGHVAYECILDLRGITKDTGVTVDDVAKRLMDHGFHAPDHEFPRDGHADRRTDRERDQA